MKANWGILIIKGTWYTWIINGTLYTWILGELEYLNHAIIEVTCGIWITKSVRCLDYLGHLWYLYY